MSTLPNAQEISVIFAAFYREAREIGYGFIFVFLILALIKEFLHGMEGKPDYAGLFVRTLLIAGLYAIYTPFFEEVSRGMELLANFFMPAQDFRTQIQKIFSAYRENHDLGMIALLKMTFLDWMMQGTYNMAYAVLRGFAWVRVVFLSALYISGPVFLGVGIFQPGMARIWVRWLFEVLSWNVVLSLFVRILFELNFFEFYTNGETLNLDLFAMNLIIILIILFFVPTFSSLMIRGAEGFTQAGGRVFGLSGTLVTKMIKQVSSRSRAPARHSAYSKGDAL